jgi:hypothetical protein
VAYGTFCHYFYALCPSVSSLCLSSVFPLPMSQFRATGHCLVLLDKEPVTVETSSTFVAIPACGDRRRR